MFIKFKKVVTEKNIIPCPKHELIEIHKLGQWKEKTQGIYKNKSGVMKDINIYNTWDNFINSDLYKNAFENNIIVQSFKLFMIEYIKVVDFEKENNYIPKSCSVDDYEKKLGYWCNSRRGDYKYNNLSLEKIKLLEEIPRWRWDTKCIECNFFQIRKNNICDDCINPNRNPKWEKTEEWKIINKIRIDYSNNSFIHDKSVGNDCTKNDKEHSNGHCRPDLRFDGLLAYDLIIEVDENRHKWGYPCEIQRMFNIISNIGRPCIFIRYNPNHKESNYNKLKKTIDKYIKLSNNIENIKFNDIENNMGLKTKYLFY